MAATTPNMGLKVWNLLTDSFDHTQLAENFAKVDQHKHIEGQGAQIPTGGIVDGAISTSKIGSEQVTPEKLSSGATENIGINTPSRTYRKVITSEETYKNETTSYTLVDSGQVYVPSNGRLMAIYTSLHKASTANGTAQIFIDGTELKVPRAGGSPIAVSTATLEVSSVFGWLLTGGQSLTAVKGETSDSNFSGTNGMTGLTTISIWGLTGGNHTVEIKAKAGSSGKVEIKTRTLWLRAEGYGE